MNQFLRDTHMNDGIYTGTPLAPDPQLLPVNSTTLALMWNAPFSWWGPASITSYIIRMYNDSNQAWKVWEVPSEVNVSDYKLVVGNTVQSACATLTFMVSAINTAGEGMNGTASGGLPKG